MEATAAPVLVVGGRTTGLMMAAELVRHGVAVRIIDKSPGIDPHCRATVLHSRTLEILDQLGLARPIMEVSQPLRGYAIFVNGKCFGHSAEDPVDSPFPVAVALSQAQTEGYLERHLNDLGVTVQRSTQLTAIDQQADGIQATLLHADGREEIVDTPWLIGCDGAHSTVRHLTEESFPGEADPYPYMLADVVVEGELDGQLQPDQAYVCLCDAGDLFLFILNEGRRMIAANVPKGSDISQPPTLEQMQQVVTQRSHKDLRLSDPRWLTYFHIHYRVAPHYRQGRIFLAGDAAHIHSLIGGHGMNTGIQDAHNLAWKLALVNRGLVPLKWLDTYETERRQVAQDVVATTKQATETMEMLAGLATEERNRLVEHMFVPETEKSRIRCHEEEIDLDYQSSHICIDSDDVFDGGPSAGTRVPNAEPILVNGERCTFFDVLSGPYHSLILFGPAEGGNDNLLQMAANSVIQTHGHWIDVCVVANSPLETAIPTDATFIEDPQSELRKRLGIRDTGLYLIRPDGYVAFRSCRVDSLTEYLDRVL